MKPGIWSFRFITLLKLAACLYICLPHGSLLGEYWSNVPGVEFLIYALVYYAWILPAWTLSRIILGWILSKQEDLSIGKWSVVEIMLCWSVLRIVMLYLLVVFLTCHEGDAVMRWIKEFGMWESN
jgi:hypothetical protein